MEGCLSPTGLEDSNGAVADTKALAEVMVQRAHQLGTGQPLRLPGSARDRMQAQEAKHARRRVKEDRRKASRARAAAEAAPVLEAAVALATAEAVPRKLMVGESGLAYRPPSRGEEPDWPGQPEGAHLPESLSEHFGGEVVASPYLPPIV